MIRGIFSPSRIISHQVEVIPDSSGPEGSTRASRRLLQGLSGPGGFVRGVNV